MYWLNIFHWCVGSRHNGWRAWLALWHVGPSVMCTRGCLSNIFHHQRLSWRSWLRANWSNKGPQQTRTTGGAILSWFSNFQISGVWYLCCVLSWRIPDQDYCYYQSIPWINLAWLQWYRGSATFTYSQHKADCFVSRFDISYQSEFATSVEPDERTFLVDSQSIEPSTIGHAKSTHSVVLSQVLTNVFFNFLESSRMPLHVLMSHDTSKRCVRFEKLQVFTLFLARRARTSHPW